MARRKGLYEVDGELVSEKTPPARGMPESRVLAVNPIERVECHGDPGKSPVAWMGKTAGDRNVRMFRHPQRVETTLLERQRKLGRRYLSRDSTR